jgi:hypothetical protein
MTVFVELFVYGVRPMMEVQMICRFVSVMKRISGTGCNPHVRKPTGITAMVRDGSSAAKWKGFADFQEMCISRASKQFPLHKIY